LLATVEQQSTAVAYRLHDASASLPTAAGTPMRTGRLKTSPSLDHAGKQRRASGIMMPDESSFSKLQAAARPGVRHPDQSSITLAAHGWGFADRARRRRGLEDVVRIG
jgi:hypothetical protein